MGQGNPINIGKTSRGSSIVLSSDDRSRHLYTVGTTGSGKTKFLEGLIRQDILSWHRSRCGMLLLDVHGSLYDGVAGWLATRDLRHLPIVPLDLRRGDWVVSYNPLRHRPGLDPAPLVNSFVRAVLHAWGQTDTSETPRLVKWLSVILRTLYHARLTLHESLDLIRSPAFRRSMASAVEDDLSKAVWQAAAYLKETDFQDQLESTMNRLCKFLGTQILRLALSQSENSLDFDAALRKGSIVLVSLAGEGSNFDEEDAATLASLMLSDLWSAAKARGKREAGKAKPFYVYLDEFQEYTQPSIAKGLAQARGFGVHVTLANQSMTQLTDAGPIGVKILNAVLANARTKVAFQVQHQDDLDVLSQWLYRNEVDLDQVKNQPYATRVLGHEIRYMESTSESRGAGVTDGANWGETETASDSVSSTWSHSEGTTSGTSDGGGRTRSRGTGRSRTKGSSSGDSSDEGESDGSNWSRGTGRSRQDSSATSEAKSISGDFNAVDWEDEELEFDGEFERPRYTPDAARTWSQATSAASARGESESQGHGGSSSRSRSRGRQRGESQSDSDSVQQGESDSATWGSSQSRQSSDSFGGGISSTFGTSVSRGGSRAISRTLTRGTTLSPMLLPLLGLEALPPQFRTIEEQLFKFMQFLSSQPDRRCVVRIGIGAPVQIQTLSLDAPRITAKGARAWVNLRLRKLDFMLSSGEALRRIGIRHAAIAEKLKGPGADAAEPTTYSRVIGRKP